MSLEDQMKLRGFEKWEATITALAPAVLEAGKQAVKEMADEWESQAHTIVSAHDQTGALDATIKQTAGDNDLSIKVTIGDKTAPYPVHLEEGHFDHGKFVPGIHVLFPAIKKVRAKAKRKMRAAVRKTIKAGVGNMLKITGGVDDEP